jgi:hypothetical protein
MKTIFALVTTLLVGSAFAQTPRHMIEFNADSSLLGNLSFARSKNSGGESNRKTNLHLDLNYAYALESMPRLQLGGNFLYSSGGNPGRGNFEDYFAQAGVWLNHRETLNDTLYLKAMAGFGWANNYTRGTRKDEATMLTLAVGHRFPLARWGMSHIVYSPEVAFQNTNSTTGGDLEYSQEFQIRFLQFSALF